MLYELRTYTVKPGSLGDMVKTASTLARGQPLTMRGIQVVRLGPDSTLELRTHTVRKAAAATELSVEHGVASKDP